VSTVLCLVLFRVSDYCILSLSHCGVHVVYTDAVPTDFIDVDFY